MGWFIRFYTAAWLPPFQPEVPERGYYSEHGPNDQDPHRRWLVESRDEQDAGAQQHEAERPQVPVLPGGPGDGPDPQRQ